MADVEVVVGADLLDAEAELLGGVSMSTLGAHSVLLLPREDRLLDAGREFEIEPVVHAADRTFRIRHQFTMVDVEEAVLADARPFLDGALHALAKMLADLAPQSVQIP